MKNTIEDFTDDKEIIEIEKLMLDKKWNKASERIIDYYGKNLEDIFYTPKDKEKEFCKFYILTFMFVICNQHINLKLAINAIIYILNQTEDLKNIAPPMFLSDILQKILNKYYDEEQIEIVHKTASSFNTTVEKMKDIAKKEIQIILMTAEAEALIENIENKIGIYLFNKFQC